MLFANHDYILHALRCPCTSSTMNVLIFTPLRHFGFGASEWRQVDCDSIWEGQWRVQVDSFVVLRFVGFGI